MSVYMSRVGASAGAKYEPRPIKEKKKNYHVTGVFSFYTLISRISARNRFRVAALLLHRRRRSRRFSRGLHPKKYFIERDVIAVWSFAPSPHTHAHAHTHPLYFNVRLERFASFFFKVTKMQLFNIFN